MIPAEDIGSDPGDATPTDRSDEPVAAAIDIGSNSIKMTVARATPDRGLEEIGWASEAVLLGRGLELTGRLDEERMAAAIDAIARFATQAREMGAREVVAVATEAVRAADNGHEFRDRLNAETGLVVQVIDGEREAALTFRGLAATSDVSGLIVVADIGGGSTELIVAHDGVVLDAVSVTLGSGRLTDRFISADPPTRQQFARSVREASKTIGKEKTLLGLIEGAGARLLILGGTGEYLARLIGAERTIELDALRDAMPVLLGTSAEALAGQLAIPLARARVLPAGAAIVTAIADAIAPTQVEIARSGIRVGLLLDVLGIGDSAAPVVTASGTSQEDRLPRTARESPDSGAPPVASARFRDAMRCLIAKRWDGVWAAIPGAIEGADIEGVHAVRVASRRLRAAMDTGAPCFPAKWYRPLHQAAKEITGALGEVRDRDVLLEALRADRENAAITERPGIDRLIERVDRERIEARAAMESYLGELQQGSLRDETRRRFGSRVSRGSGEARP